MLNEFRVHTSVVEQKVNEAQALLHNSQALLRDLIADQIVVEKENLHKLQAMLTLAEHALDMGN